MLLSVLLLNILESITTPVKKLIITTVIEMLCGLPHTPFHPLHASYPQPLTLRRLCPPSHEVQRHLGIHHRDVINLHIDWLIASMSLEAVKADVLIYLGFQDNVSTAFLLAGKALHACRADADRGLVVPAGRAPPMVQPVQAAAVATQSMDPLQVG